MKASVIVLSIIVLMLASQGWAGSTKSLVPDTDTTKVNGHFKLALHVERHGTHTCSAKNALTIASFDDIVRNLDTFDGAGIDAFLVVFDYDSITSVEYGLSWPAEWGSAESFVCVPNNLSIGSIVNPGDGMIFSWTGDPSCRIPNGQPGGNTAPFFVTSFTYVVPTGAGEIVIRDDPDFENPPTFDGKTAVTSCGGDSTRIPSYPEYVYDAGIQMPTGIYEGPPRFATEPSTWGAIKSIFK
jgi:hypothetical protein